MDEKEMLECLWHSYKMSQCFLHWFSMGKSLFKLVDITWPAVLMVAIRWQNCQAAQHCFWWLENSLFSFVTHRATIDMRSLIGTIHSLARNPYLNLNLIQTLNLKSSLNPKKKWGLAEMSSLSNNVFSHKVLNSNWTTWRQQYKHINTSTDKTHAKF